MYRTNLRKDDLPDGEKELLLRIIIYITATSELCNETKRVLQLFSPLN
jgi:hypothetical protein